VFFEDLGECSRFPFGFHRFVWSTCICIIYLYLYSHFVLVCNLVFVRGREPGIVYVYTCDGCL